MKITVVGLGAIGSLFAYSLKQAGHQVSIWTRDHASSKSLRLDNNPSYSFPANEPKLLQNAELVLICTKSWQLESALKQTIDLIPKTTPILISHNGMGAIEKSQSNLTDRPILFATTTHGALKTDSKTVMHTGAGQTTLGSYNEHAPEMQRLVGIFNDALPDALWHSNIKQALWDKLAINCCINPLTALHNCRNGALNTPKHLAEIKAICREIALVMNAEGFSAQQDHLFEKAQSVIRATSANYSSMHQDVAHQRMTEIDYISGYLLNRAKAHAIQAPHNQDLYNKIKQLEANYDH